MIKCLNQDIQWERYHCVFFTLMAHEQIIGKRSMFPGQKVLQHLVDINKDSFFGGTKSASSML